MAEERAEVASSDLARWVVIAVVLVIGIALYFWLSPSTVAVVSSVQELAP
ncbi:MAG: hypothetical protein ABI637_10610 [Gemmatimonadota bacterium]